MGTFLSFDLSFQILVFFLFFFIQQYHVRPEHHHSGAASLLSLSCRTDLTNLITNTITNQRILLLLLLKGTLNNFVICFHLLFIFGFLFFFYLNLSLLTMTIRSVFTSFSW